MTLTIDSLLSFLTDRGTASAYDIARAFHCQPEQPCALLREQPDAWWTVEIIAGPEGWLYRKREFVTSYAPRKPKPRSGEVFFASRSDRGGY